METYLSNVLIYVRVILCSGLSGCSDGS